MTPDSAQSGRDADQDQDIESRAHRGAPDEGVDEPRQAPGCVSLATSDPEVRDTVGGPRDWADNPDATISVETSDVRGSVAVPVSTVRPVPVTRPRRRTPDKGKEHGRRQEQPGEPAPKTGFSTMRSVLLASAVALVCGFLAAAVYEYFLGGKGDSDQQQASAASKKRAGGAQEHKQGKSGGGGSSKKNQGSDEEETGSASNEGDTIPGFTTAEDADSLRKQIGQMSERLDALQHRIDSLRPSPEQTPPDLHTLQIKVGDMARTLDDIADLPSRLRRAVTRMDSLEQQIKMVRDLLAARDDQNRSQPVMVVDKPPSVVTGASAPRVAGSPRSELLITPDAALEQAIALFKLGQYVLASKMLAELRETQPDDARVWYFSALLTGLTSGHWEGQAQRLAEKGLDCERAGTPSRDQIEESLQGVTRTQGSDWLGVFRARLTKKL